MEEERCKGGGKGEGGRGGTSLQSHTRMSQQARREHTYGVSNSSTVDANEGNLEVEPVLISWKDSLATTPQAFLVRRNASKSDATL